MDDTGAWTKITHVPSKRPVVSLSDSFTGDEEHALKSTRVAVRMHALRLNRLLIFMDALFLIAVLSDGMPIHLSCASVDSSPICVRLINHSSQKQTVGFPI